MRWTALWVTNVQPRTAYRQGVWILTAKLLHCDTAYKISLPVELISR